MDYIKDIAVDWNQKKIVKHGLAKGTYYKIYIVIDGDLIWRCWMSRKEIKHYNIFGY